MANLAVDDWIQLTIQYRKLIPQAERFINRVFYRLSVGTPADEKATYEAFVTQWWTTCGDSLLANLRGDLNVRELRVNPFSGGDRPDWSFAYADSDKIGEIAMPDAGIDQASGCLVRRNFRTGRKSVGRLFFPLAPAFIQGSALTVDPTGSGDLRDVISALGANIVTTAPAATWVPVVFNPNGDLPMSSVMDVREQYWSESVSFLHSRKPGIGV